MTATQEQNQMNPPLPLRKQHIPSLEGLLPQNPTPEEILQWHRPSEEQHFEDVDPLANAYSALARAHEYYGEKTYSGNPRNIPLQISVYRDARKKLHSALASDKSPENVTAAYATFRDVVIRIQ